MFRTLHAAKIEIVSPAFMSQRVYDAQSKVLAKSNHTVSQEDKSDSKSPETMIFDKAESAEKKSILEQRKKLLKEKIAKLEASLADNDIDEEEVNKKIDDNLKIKVKRSGLYYNGELCEIILEISETEVKIQYPTETGIGYYIKIVNLSDLEIVK